MGNQSFLAQEELSLAAQMELLPRVKHSVASVARLLEVTSDVVLQALQDAKGDKTGDMGVSENG